MSDVSLVSQWTTKTFTPVAYNIFKTYLIKNMPSSLRTLYLFDLNLTCYKTAQGISHHAPQKALHTVLVQHMAEKHLVLVACSERPVV